MHIKDFDDFHQTVINSRLSYGDYNEQTSLLQIKLEEPEVEIPADFNYKYDAYLDKEKDADDNEADNDKQNDLNPINEDCKDNSDDENEQPLINLKRKQNSCKDSRKTEETVTKDNKEEEIAKLQCKRKLKDVKRKSSKTIKFKDISKEQKNKKVSQKVQESNRIIAEWKSTLECDICKANFATYDLLNTHFKEIHNSRCYIRCCDLKFDSRTSFVDHIRVHIDPDTHKCDICGKRNSNTRSLRLHKKIVHSGVHKYECHECHKTFPQKCNLDRHLLTHVSGSKDFKCEICDRAYVFEVQLKSHIKLAHSDNRVCDQCGKTFTNAGALNHHRKMQHDTDIEKRTFPCDECGTVLKTNYNLKQHKASYHSDGSTIYVCSICGKVAPNERALITHRRYVHEKERKYKCSYCDKAFKRPVDLAEHTATHTGEDLYQCPHCPRTFKVSANCNEHRKKAHPLEWEESRKNLLEKQKINLEKVQTQITL